MVYKNKRIKCLLVNSLFPKTHKVYSIANYFPNIKLLPSSVVGPPLHIISYFQVFEKVGAKAPVKTKQFPSKCKYLQDIFYLPSQVIKTEPSVFVSVSALMAEPFGEGS